MTNLAKIELSPPVFPQANGTDTINMHDVHVMGNRYLLMNVGKYVDEEIGDEIVGYLRFNDGSVITSIPYYITPDKQDFSPYSLLFPVDDITRYGSYQAQYKIVSHGNERDSPTVNINLVFSDSSSLSDSLPSVPEATGNQGKLLTKDDYYRLDQLKINVPVYEGMAPGHTVKVLWQGRRKDITYSTPTQTVNEVAPMTFYIPRLEFIDNIGDTVQIRFAVERTSDNYIEYSGSFRLEIEKQDLDLPAPNLNYNFDDGSIQVIVSYPGMTLEQTVEIRLIGNTMRQTNYQRLDNVQQMVIGIPSDWAQENRGRLVLIDYAVGDIYGNKYRFSHILRRVL
ncbi:hypothetical protein PSI15_13195 [Xenorhabdus sp. PR6a]|uniref:hypothetical protein n=1 Tax=Xenorhabdus sp. PR6a TaxID=3025877 RepID=UPI0023595250|nr:hypothetical protein [Xenorhabdus sp. PR6a]MDC9582509.1 hypothetical protein [Xenorhabdus sp. PR6a]